MNAYERAVDGTLSDASDNLLYEPDTGIFRWKSDRRCGRGKGRVIATAGSVTGSKMTVGYILIRFNGHQFLAHRLAWAMFYGRWPSNEIDHINGDRKDNRIINLREATSQQNKMNRKTQSNNKLRVKGVSVPHKLSSKYRARIRCNGVVYDLGVFGTIDEAHAAYCDKAAELHESFSNYGG